jgi:hypothetical protein
VSERTDTERLDWLQSVMHSADFGYDTGEARLQTVLLFRFPRHARIGANLRTNIDTVMDAPAGTFDAD